MTDGRSGAAWAGLSTVAVGALVLIAWKLALVDPARTAPRASAAVMFIVAGFSLLAAIGSGVRARQVQRISATLLLASAVFNLLLRVRDGHGGHWFDNTISHSAPLPTAIAFLFIAVSLLTLRRRPLVGYAAALAVGLIVLTGFSGYSLGLAPSDTVLAGMSPFGFIGLLVAVIGLLSLWPELPPFAWIGGRTVGARLARRLVPAIIGLPLLLGFGATRWEQFTGLSAASGMAVMAAGVIAMLTTITAISVGMIDRSDRQAEAARRRTVAAMRESEHRFRSLAMEVPAGIVSRDEQGAVTFVNDEARRIFGLRPDAAHEAMLPHFLHPDDRDVTFPPIQRAIDSGGAIKQEIRIQRPDGASRWLMMHGAAQTRSDGSFAGYLATFTDVTERRHSHEALSESEELFKAAFDEAPIGMAIVALDATFTRVNGALCASTGHTADELTGLAPYALVHPEDRSPIQAVFGALGGEDDSMSLEHRILHADGHSTWVSTHLTLARDEAGVARYALAQLQDITARRDYERKLEHMAHHDGLTGLLNRRGFEARLREQLAHARRYDTGGALLMLDLDGFKAVNDTFGHAGGDRLIVAIADALTARLRESDTIARFGGDEFAVFLPGQNHEEALLAGRGLVETVRAAAATMAVDRPSSVTASIGVAPLDPGATTDELIRRGDSAMYEAKESGKDRVVGYVPR